MVNEWTRADLPAVMDLVKASVDAVATDPSGGAYAALDAVVEHLNANHPKPRPIDEAEFLDLYIDVIAETSGLERRALWSHRVWAKKIVERLNANGGVPASRGDAALADHLGRQAVAIDELQLDLEAAEADRDRWRRAHEIVERERDQAREQWKKWEHKANEAEREVSTWRTSTESAHSDFLQAAHERDEAVARAVVAEARTAPAVTRDDIEKAIRGKVWAANRDPNKAGFHRVHIAWATDSVWSLVSGADPAVHVVRESDVAAVEVEPYGDNWKADGRVHIVRTLPEARSDVQSDARVLARSLAVARAIEAGQAADPLLDKAQEFAALADWELTDREAELLHTVAAHVLGQEDRHVDQ